MRADNILNQIDTALEDWTVSGDAMRSQPPAETPDAPVGMRGHVPVTEFMDEMRPRFWIAPVGTAIDADGWQETGYITSGDFGIDQATIDPATFATPQPTVTWQEIVNCIAQIEAGRARRAQLLEDFVRAFTESIEAVQPCIEEAGQAIAEAVEQAAPPQPPVRRIDRPAWQSPYGPAPRSR